MAYTIKNSPKDGKNIVRRGISVLFLPFGTTAWINAPGARNFTDNPDRQTQKYGVNEVGIDETLLEDTTSITRTIAYESILSEDPDLKQLHYGSAPVSVPSVAPAAFQASHAYALGDLADLGHGSMYFRITTAGTSAASAPSTTSVTAAGDVVVSGGATFTAVPKASIGTIDAYIEDLDSGEDGALVIHIQTAKKGAKNKVKFLRKVYLQGDGTGDDNGAETLKFKALQTFVDYAPPSTLASFGGRQARFTTTYEYPAGDTAAFDRIMDALTTLGTAAP